MKKQVNILYGVDDTLPLAVTIVRSFQEEALLSFNRLFPQPALKAVRTPTDDIPDAAAVDSMFMIELPRAETI